MKNDEINTIIVTQGKGSDMSKWLINNDNWLPIVNKKQKRIYIIGIISIIVGSILYFGSLFVDLFFIQTYEVTGSDILVFDSYLKLAYLLLISGTSLFVSGTILIIYTRSSYYRNKWVHFQRINNNA